MTQAGGPPVDAGDPEIPRIASSPVCRAPHVARVGQVSSSRREAAPHAVPEQALPAPGTVQSVARALRALEFVAGHRDGVTAKEMAAHLDLAVPSTYHLLTTLTSAGYLVHLAQEHRYGLGYRVRLLEQGLERQLAAPARIVDTLRRLHLEADAAAYYAVYRDADVVVAHVVDSARRPRVRTLDVGFHEAAHATAFGKVMLAAMSAEERAGYLERAGLRRCSEHTIVDRAELEEHLSHVRRSGVALEIGEFQNGLSCLAAPVRSSAGAVVASVAVSLPSAELAARRWQVERAVRHGASATTRAVNQA